MASSCSPASSSSFASASNYAVKAAVTVSANNEAGRQAPTAADPTPESVLRFWFGDSQGFLSLAPTIPMLAIGNASAAAVPDQAGFMKWFKASNEFDNELRQRFGNLIIKAASGEYDQWRKSLMGRMALIIVFDQFPRNVFRGSPQAFAYAPEALALVNDLIESDEHKQLPAVQRAFVYLPLQHAEDRAAQALAVRCYQELLESLTNASDRPIFEDFLNYSRRHQVTVDRFGRFPSRNAVLGRESTPEELQFLSKTPQGF
eukprot:jgi/Chlat1/4506/Chrsp29S04578